MSWGKGIVIVMALFMSFIIFLAVKLMTKRVDLQSEDYYKKEIQYDQEIAAETNANKLKSKIVLTKDNQFVITKLPADANFTDVTIDLLRLNNKKLDKHFVIEGTKTYLIPKSILEKGDYLVEIRFQSDSQVCLQKEHIYI
jgi:hypothetical protein